MRVVEDYLSAIERVTCHNTRGNKEPVRDRMEFSIACQSFLYADREWNPDHPTGLPFEVYFFRVATWDIRDYQRNQRGRYVKRKPTIRLTWDVVEESGRFNVVEELNEAIESIDDEKIKHELKRRILGGDKNSCITTCTKRYRAGLALLRERLQ